jgi:hypothetical protein
MMIIQITSFHNACTKCRTLFYAGADPGFVVRGGVSRRGVWGPHTVPQRVVGRALVGGPGGRSPSPPPKLWGFEELQTFN